MDFCQFESRGTSKTRSQDQEIRNDVVLLAATISVPWPSVGLLELLSSQKRETGTVSELWSRNCVNVEQA